MQVIQTDSKQTQLVYDIDTQQLVCCAGKGDTAAAERAAAAAKQRGWID